MNDSDAAITPIESVAQSILTLRGQRVILDADLARLYEVETGAFNRAVKRNLKHYRPTVCQKGRYCPYFTLSLMGFP